MRTARLRSRCRLHATATKTKTKTTLRPIPQAVPAQSAPEWRERHWFPVASTLELDPKRPTPVRIDGLDLVVWQVPGEEGHENGGWKVMLDSCAHRLAPLSEGRIEPKTGCLQCAYHGWEFNSEGSCTKIPQVEEAEAVKMCANPRSRVRSFPTTVALKLVWVWLGESEPKGSPGELVTGTHLDEMEILGSYTRDLPYGYDSLLENLIDVSHVPFAHHGLQGTRDDAIPISMTIPDTKESTEIGDLLNFTFWDRTMGLKREANFSLRSPFFFFYLGEFLGDTDSKEEYEKLLIHLLSNRFLDSDLAFLHYQERKLRQAPYSSQDWSNSYFMPGESDRSISAWRAWLAKDTSGSGPREGARCVDPENQLPPSPMSREELLNRWDQHSAHCKHCREAFESLAVWQRGFGLTFVAALAAAQTSLLPAMPCLGAEVVSVAGLAAVEALKQDFHLV
eukprot:s137_g9.t1